MDAVRGRLARVADEHAGPETLDAVGFGKVLRVAPDGNHAVALNRPVVGLVDEIRAVLETRIQQSARGSVTAHNQRVVFVRDRLVYQRLRVDGIASDFDDFHFRHARPDVFQYPGILVTHV